MRPNLLPRTLALTALGATSLAILPYATASKKPATRPASRPTTRPARLPLGQTYAVRQVEGWTVRVNNDLLTSHKAVGEEALKLLAAKLYQLNRTVPPKALAALHDVHIWLERDNPGFTCAVYHPSAKWLETNGFDPAKAQCVEIANAKRFLSLSRQEPAMVLHELAHAYHHQVLGHGHRQIAAAYRRAVESQSYEKVLHFSGKTKRAYALKNKLEYFAELSEAYFGTNDFYPFVRAEIMKHDPVMFQLLGKVWR